MRYFILEQEKKLNLWQPLRKVFLFVALAMVFNLGVLIFRGADAGLEFLGGYLIEFSLSLDNIFVFISIFTAFLRHSRRGRAAADLYFFGRTSRQPFSFYPLYLRGDLDYQRR